MTVSALTADTPGNSSPRFVDDFCFDIRVFRQQIPDPVERIRRRLEPGDDQRHELVEQFGIGETRPLLVHGAEVHRQEIERVGLLLSPRLDNAHQQLAQLAHLHDDAEIAGRVPAQERERILPRVRIRVS